jgi:hypothetical protein
MSFLRVAFFRILKMKERKFLPLLQSHLPFHPVERNELKELKKQKRGEGQIRERKRKERQTLVKIVVMHPRFSRIHQLMVMSREKEKGYPCGNLRGRDWEVC